MLERSRIIRPTFEDVFYIDQFNDELRRDPLSWKREWLRRVPRLQFAPALQGTRVDGQTATGTSHVLDLPASPQVGECIVVSARSAGGTAGSTISWPGDWTVVTEETVDPGTFYRLNTARRFVTAGNQADTTVTITTSMSVSSVRYISSRYSGVSPVPAPSGTSTTGTSATPDPPNHAPGLGSREFCWYVVALKSGGSATITAAPTNYGNYYSATNQWACADRTLAASSENPGAFSGTTSVAWIAQTVALAPAVLPLFMHHYRQMRGN